MTLMLRSLSTDELQIKNILIRNVDGMNQWELQQGMCQAWILRQLMSSRSKTTVCCFRLSPMECLFELSKTSRVHANCWNFEGSYLQRLVQIVRLLLYANCYRYL